jgi:hypothetical protein
MNSGLSELLRVEHAGAEHGLRADESGIQRDHGHLVGSQFVCHVRGHLVGRGFGEDRTKGCRCTSCAAQDEMCTMSPRRAFTIIRAACWLATKADFTPEVIIASHRQTGCSQNGNGPGEAPPPSTIRSYPAQALFTRCRAVPVSSSMRPKHFGHGGIVAMVAGDAGDVRAQICLRDGAAGREDPGTGVREAERDTAPDAPAGAGDERHLSM